MLVEVFLFPFYVFKYFFSFMAWVFLVSILFQTDWYYDLRDWFNQRYR